MKLQQPAACGAELVESLAKTIKEFGEYAASVAERIADGDVAPEKIVKIDRETNGVVEAFLSFCKLARATYEAKYSK